MDAWRRDDAAAGHSVARVERTATGWTTHGVEVLAGDEVLGCWFRVDLTAEWRTRRVEVRALSNGGETTRVLDAVDGRWSIDGAPAAHLDGCIDVDIAATPLTNTYPIRRFASLPVGESRTTPIAWVDVPSLQVHRVEQTYERLGPLRWRYSDPQHGAFLLDVDEDGVVERYEGFAVRI